MTDWNNPATIAQAFYAATALMWLCIGIYAYDTLQYLTFDLAIIFGKRQRRWPQLPYIFSKICMWTYLLTNMICFLTNTEINCNGTVKAIEMQMGWIAVSSSMLLAFRAVCVYTGKTRTVVSVVLTIMTLGLLAAWMEGVKDLDAAWVLGAGNPWQSGACVFTRLSTQYAIKYVVTIVFDLIVMILTVVGVVRMNTGSRIGTVLVKQGIQYFLFTFMINALVAGLTLANLNPVMSLIGAIPSATVCVMCSTRLYVHLAEEAKPKPEGVNSSQLSSTFSGEKLARFFKRSTGTGGNTSRLQPSFASRSGVSSKDSTAVGGGVGSLSYTVRNGSHSPVDVKSYSNEDLEAGGRSHGIVSITEERTVVQEPMPEHLAGTFDGARSSDRPYGLDSVQSQFPKLSKS